MGNGRFFYSRNFVDSFAHGLHRRIYRYFFRKFDVEIPDPAGFEALKNKDKSDRKRLLIYISGRNSKIEQFLLNGFMIENGIVPPTHSFGPKTRFFRPLGELWMLFISLFRPSIIKDRFIESLYIPVDSPEELSIDPVFAEVYRKLRHQEATLIPVITLWDKNLDKKHRWEWINQLIGRYNFWSTSWELLMFMLKRRKLTLRIGISSSAKLEDSEEVFVRRLCDLMNTSKRNVVGAALKNWLDLKNETLFKMELDSKEEKRSAIKTMNLMSSEYSPLYAEILSYFLGKILNARFSRFVYSNNEINDLCKLCALPETNTVFVPTHKSYFDYLILNYILYREKVTVPLVAAGDNLDFFPLSPVLRKMGAFFIRRKIKDDEFYKKILTTYLEQILTAGYNIEFFIEGGRSRSGMVRSPRTGMLKMLAEITKTTNRKLYIVPVSITYEKLKEIEDYNKEKHGVKQPESEHFLKKVFTLFRADYGPVYVRFSQPIMLNTKFTEETALRIAEVQEKSSVISFSAIFSAVFMAFESLTIKDLIERMELTVEILHTLPGIETAYALNNLDVNCSKLTSALLKKGALKQKSKHHEENQELTISKDFIAEFSFYKNSAAFAFAPFFCGLFRETELYSFVSEFLENTIMGYYESLYSEDPVDVSTLPDWFKTMLQKFFEDKFAILGKILELIPKLNLFAEKNLRHTAIVQRLIPKISAEIPSATADEIYEMLFFLEKKNILKDNLSSFDGTIAQEFLNKIDMLKKRS
ncbi:1-acyl-sn-glycerol-3-phosphate acyltransferase [bacterium]|nr:1-acyl-sn-glycerol-3-phosphate acyltransferase [bacterium]